MFNVVILVKRGFRNPETNAEFLFPKGLVFDAGSWRSFEDPREITSGTDKKEVSRETRVARRGDYDNPVGGFETVKGE